MPARIDPDLDDMLLERRERQLPADRRRLHRHAGRRAVRDAARDVEMPARPPALRPRAALGRDRRRERLLARSALLALHDPHAALAQLGDRSRAPATAGDTHPPARQMEPQRSRRRRRQPPAGPCTSAPCARPAAIASSAAAVEPDSATTRRGPLFGSIPAASPSAGSHPTSTKPSRSAPGRGAGRRHAAPRWRAANPGRRARPQRARARADRRRVRRALRRPRAPPRQHRLGDRRRAGANSSSTERPTAVASASAASTLGRWRPASIAPTA